MTERPLIFIECGTTLASPHNTGIQRVVRSIVAQAPEICAEFGRECRLVRFQGQRFDAVAAPDKSAVDVTQRPWQALWKAYRDIYLSLLPPRLREAQKSFSRQRKAARGAQMARDSFGGLPLDKVFAPGVEAPVLLLLDSTWKAEMWSQVDAFRQRGGQVVAVLYDLIPFTHPETAPDRVREMHTRWWREAPAHLDGVMCISRAVRDEFLLWQAAQCGRQIAPAQVGHFWLGSGFDPLDPIIQALTSGLPLYLVAGSLEPRKNHAIVLDAFEQLWVQGRDILLVMAGAHGWKSEALLQRIVAHPEFGRRLLLVRDASDRDLAALYSRCDALIAASLAEGFGLPIVEAGVFGARVICSDIPVFREVAGDTGLYFDPQNADSLCKAVLAHLDGLRANPARERRVWMSWPDSAHQLLERALRMLA